MKKAGYHRSVEQIRHRWKVLKSAYYKNKRQSDFKLVRFPQHATILTTIMDDFARNSSPSSAVNRETEVSGEENEEGETTPSLQNSLVCYCRQCISLQSYFGHVLLCAMMKKNNTKCNEFAQGNAG